MTTQSIKNSFKYASVHAGTAGARASKALTDAGVANYKGTPFQVNEVSKITLGSTDEPSAGQLTHLQIKGGEPLQFPFDLFNEEASAGHDAYLEMEDYVTDMSAISAEYMAGMTSKSAFDFVATPTQDMGFDAGFRAEDVSTTAMKNDAVSYTHDGLA